MTDSTDDVDWYKMGVAAYNVTNAHIADRILLAQLTTLCREICDWLRDGPMTDLDKRIAFADRLQATLKQANAEAHGRAVARTVQPLVGASESPKES